MVRTFGSALLFSLLCLVGCGNPSAPVVYLTLSPATTTLNAGQSVTINATISGDNAAMQAGVVWRVTGNTAVVGTLSNITANSVTYTAPATITTFFLAEVEATPINSAVSAQVTGINVENPLAITTTTLPAGTVGTVYSTTNLAATGGTTPFTYAVTAPGLPPGLTLNPAVYVNAAGITIPAGQIAGTPTSPGTYTFTITASGSEYTPTTASATYTIVIAPVKLILNAITLPVGVAGVAYPVQTFTAAGGIPPYTYSVSSGKLPPGLSLTSGGVLSGTPTAAGPYTFTVQVADTEAVPMTATGTFTITIYSPLVITTTTLPNGAVKTPYSAQLASTGGGGTITYTVSAGSALPAGLTLSSTGAISGTPTTAGTTMFTVQATDSATGQTATSSLSIMIVQTTLMITTTSLPSGAQGVPYTATLMSTGGNAPITWMIQAGSGTGLPTGLTLSSTGVISGTPMVFGTFTFTVIATDAVGGTANQTLTLVIGSLAITTTSLPAGNAFSAYTVTLTASGGTKPYTWTLAAGSNPLPTGLTLSTAGVLSGTPLASGTFTPTFQVSDSSNPVLTATRQLTLVVNPGAASARLNGSYAFLLNGFNAGNASGAVYGFAAVGSLSVDGVGNVTGVEDINTNTGTQQSLDVTGFYTVNTGGRGTMMLTAGTTTHTYAISTSKLAGGVAQSIALTEFDNSTGTGSTATGFARLQTATAFAVSTFKGNFSFGLSGESPCSTCVTPAPLLGPVVAVGFATGDGVSALTGGSEDAGAYGINYTGVALAGSFTAPSTTTGRGALILTPTGTLFSAPPTHYTYVVISINEFLLLSTDSHATTTLLSGDAQLQQQPTYTAATAFPLASRSIGYESQASGGNGTTTYPIALDAILTELTNTASGTATFLQDANRAGTFTPGTTAAAATYTTAATGRTALTVTTTSQVLYSYNSGAAFAIDPATATTFPGLVMYELQVPTTTALGPVQSGAFGTGTLAAPVPATISSGTSSYNPTGGVDTGSFAGILTAVNDSSTPAGVLTSGQAAPIAFYTQDATGRMVVAASDTTGAATTVIIYGISSTRTVEIPATGTTPTVTVSQQ